MRVRVLSKYPSSYFLSQQSLSYCLSKRISKRQKLFFTGILNLRTCLHAINVVKRDTLPANAQMEMLEEELVDHVAVLVVDEVYFIKCLAILQLFYSRV